MDIATLCLIKKYIDKAARADTLNYKGSDGKSAYQIAVDNGFTGTQEQWLASLVGQSGTNGKSAYQIAVDNGFVGTESEWIASLSGSDGQAPDLTLYATLNSPTFTGVPNAPTAAPGTNNT